MMCFALPTLAQREERVIHFSGESSKNEPLPLLSCERSEHDIIHFLNSENCCHIILASLAKRGNVVHFRALPKNEPPSSFTCASEANTRI
jgi:hypothetical protein